MSTPIDRILPGVALMIAFCIIAPLIDVSSKFATATVSVGVVTLARFLVQGAFMAPVAAGMGLSLRMSRQALGLSLLRAACSVGSTYFFVAALKHMPIADALAIAFIEPFIILLIGKLVMGEQVGPRRLAASVVGFVGALFVIQPSFVVFGAVALLPVGTAFTFGTYMMVTRALSRHVHPVAMQFQTAVLGAVITLVLLFAGTLGGEPSLTFALPTGIAWMFCFGVGFFATISHMAMTYALRFAPSSTLAPLHYLEIVTATLFGYLFFGDFPNALTWIGIAIIVGSGLYIIHRERVVARAARARAAAPVMQGQA